MSGGGKIIERLRTVNTDSDDPTYRKTVTRYLVVDPTYLDETYVMAEPADDEPALGETIWWGAGKDIWWGPNDNKTLTKVGYSWSIRP